MTIPFRFWLIIAFAFGARAFAFSESILRGSLERYEAAKAAGNERDIEAAYRELARSYADVANENIRILKHFDVPRFFRHFDQDSFGRLTDAYHASNGVKSGFALLLKPNGADGTYDEHALVSDHDTPTNFLLPKDDPGYLNFTHASLRELSAADRAIRARFTALQKSKVEFGDFGEKSDRFDFSLSPDNSFLYYPNTTREAIHNLERKDFAANVESHISSYGRGYEVHINLWHYLNTLGRPDRWRSTAKEKLFSHAFRTLRILNTLRAAKSLCDSLQGLEFRALSALLDPVADERHPQNLVREFAELETLVTRPFDTPKALRLKDLLQQEFLGKPERIRQIVALRPLLKRWDILWAHAKWQKKEGLASENLVRRSKKSTPPHFDASDFHNLRTFAKKGSVANSLRLGGTAGPKFAILVGPTGMGKSTLIRAIGQSIYLPLIGLSSAAQSVTVSPGGFYFFKLPSQDDPQNELSLFMKQVEAQLDFIAQVQPPATLIFDDTDPNASADIRYALQKALYDELIERPGLQILVVTHTTDVAEAYAREVGERVWTSGDVGIFHMEKYRVQPGFAAQTEARYHSAASFLKRFGASAQLIARFRKTHRDFTERRGLGGAQCPMILGELEKPGEGS